LTAKFFVNGIEEVKTDVMIHFLLLTKVILNSGIWRYAPDMIGLTHIQSYVFHFYKPGCHVG